jgi:hypothetical protein
MSGSGEGLTDALTQLSNDGSGKED